MIKHFQPDQTLKEVADTITELKLDDCIVRVDKEGGHLYWGPELEELKLRKLMDKHNPHSKGTWKN